VRVLIPGCTGSGSEEMATAIATWADAAFECPVKLIAGERVDYLS